MFALWRWVICPHMKKKLTILSPDPAVVREIQAQTGCHPVIARILANRGISSKSAIEGFLNPNLSDIQTFETLRDMDKAVARIAEALLRNEKILVYGDYDTDGVTATTVLYEFLSAAGASVAYYIPHRTLEGYGLNVFQIDNVIIPGKFHLVITIDCGSSSHEAVEKAARAGIDIIITDHHGISDPLPKAVAVVNPKRYDCPSTASYLAGVGVAFCLIIRLRRQLREIHFWGRKSEPNLKDFCDLVALGTIADVVPLINDNRIMTRAGLDIINTNPRPGIAALIHASAITKTALDAEDIAFKLSPRLNAAGRLDHATLAVKLLTTKNKDEAFALAKHLNVLNARRQEVEQKIFQEVLMYLSDTPEAFQKNAIILGKSEWHEGVLGIVASRLVEKFHRPAILISFHGNTGKGSGRSIPGIHLYDALCECSPCLETFGGHAMAAGIRIKKEKIQKFRDCFEENIAAQSTGHDRIPELTVDSLLTFDMISEKLMDELTLLQPFGQDNPEPLFCAKNVRVTHSKIIGNGHRRLSLVQGGNAAAHPLNAIWFNPDGDDQTRQHFDKLVFKLRWNHWNGKKSLQAMVENH